MRGALEIWSGTDHQISVMPTHSGWAMFLAHGASGPSGLTGGGDVPPIDAFPLRLTEEILHHLRRSFAHCRCRARPSRTPTLTLVLLFLAILIKGSNVRKSCTTSSVSNIETWGRRGLVWAGAPFAQARGASLRCG